MKAFSSGAAVYSFDTLDSTMLEAKRRVAAGARGPCADQPPVEVVDGWRDSFSYALAPGQGFEVKLTMEAGQVAGFEWQADGAVYVDMHGDSASQEHSYAIQDSSLADDGTLTAAFTGSHGWYWRNRTDQTVTVALQTRGDYGRMLHP